MQRVVGAPLVQRRDSPTANCISAKFGKVSEGVDVKRVVGAPLVQRRDSPTANYISAYFGCGLYSFFFHPCRLVQSQTSTLRHNLYLFCSRFFRPCTILTHVLSFLRKGICILFFRPNA